VALVMLALCLWGCVDGAANFLRIPLTKFNPDAVCNDGSPATAFFRAGNGTGANIWTIYLEGGGFCQDVPSCKNRWQNSEHFMISNLLPPVLNDTARSPDVNHGGINSGNASANPHFYNANQVYLWYCSSDNHAGNVTASNATGGWYFRGKVIVQTLIESLAYQSPSLSKAEHVLLTGFSAGGFGVLNNADFVGELVQKIAPNANYRAYVDSGWLQDVPTYHLGWSSSRTAMQELHSNFEAQFDATCESTYKTIGEEWRCQFAVYVYPFISTPFFLAGYQYDSPFLNDVSPPFNASTGEYAELLSRNFVMETQPLDAVFAPNCYCHGVESYDARWNFIVVNGTTASTAVWDFLNGKPTRNYDTCLPIGCNPTCSCVYNPQEVGHVC